MRKAFSFLSKECNLFKKKSSEIKMTGKIAFVLFIFSFLFLKTTSFAKADFQTDYSNYYNYANKLLGLSGGDTVGIVGSASTIDSHLCQTDYPVGTHPECHQNTGNLFDRLIPNSFYIGSYKVNMRGSDSSHPNGRYECTDLVIDSYNSILDPNYQTKSNGLGMSDNIGCIGSNGGMVDFFKNNKDKGYVYYDFYNDESKNDQIVLQSVQPGYAIFFVWANNSCSNAVKSITGADFAHVGIVKDIKWTDEKIGKGTLDTFESNAGSPGRPYAINDLRFTDVTSVGGFGGFQKGSSVSGLKTQ